MKIKSKIRLREGRAIGGELGVRIVEGGNGLCMMFKPQCVHILHFLTKPGEPIVIEMSFHYTDRTEFIGALYRWCCGDRDCFAYKHGRTELCYDGFHFMFDFDELSDSHCLAVAFITNFKQKLKTKLKEEVIEVVDENPMPDLQTMDILLYEHGKVDQVYVGEANYYAANYIAHYRPKNGKLELIWSRDK